MSTFGENLRALRKSRGYTQEKFASIIDSNQANVTAWERGYRMPNLATIKHIADTFKVPLTSLIPLEETGMEDDDIRWKTDFLQSDPKIRLLFDRVKFLSQDDLDVVLHVVNAIAKERNND